MDRESGAGLPPRDQPSTAQDRAARGRSPAAEVHPSYVAPDPEGSIPFAPTGLDRLLKEPLRLIFEHSSIGMAIVDLDGRWLMFNRATCDLFGQEAEELGSRGLLDLVEPGDLEALRGDLDPQAGPSRVVDRQFRHPRKRSFWGRLNLLLTVLPDGSRPVRICQIEDVTAGRGDPQASAQEQDLLASLVSMAPVAIALFDKSMRYVAHSERWLEIHGQVGQSIIGRSHYDVVTEIPERWKEIHRRGLAGEVLSSNEDSLSPADGDPQHFRWAVRPWRRSGGEIAGLIIVADRIDDLIFARRVAAEASRLKGEFLANMSHEIRTPMNGVLGMVALLLETELSAEQQDLAATILDSGQALLTLMNDVLELSRIEASSLPLELADFDLRDVCHEVLNALHPAADAKDLELICDIPPDLGAYYRGDSGRIRQVLLHLVGNAIKFTAVGEVRLAVRTSRPDPVGAADAPRRVELAVHDTGVGVVPDRQGAIFDSFVQGDGGASRAHGGAGLGLAICRNLAERLGGSITLSSEPGRGSTFRVEIPLVEVAKPPRPDRDERPLEALTVVVADPSDAGRGAARAHLEAWGAGVVEADTVEEALSQAEGVARPGRRAVLLISDRLIPSHAGLRAEVAARPALAGVGMVPVISPLRPRPDDPALGPTLARPIRPDGLLAAIRAATDGTAPVPALGAGARGGREPGLVGLRVLLVEDNKTNQKVAGKMLDRLGCRFEVAANGLEALQLLDRAEYDIALMDVSMPGMDGYQATAAIRQREASRPGHHPLPIIAMTAHAMQGDRERCLAAQMNDYLSKPVDVDELARLLDRWARRDRGHRPGPKVLRLARLQELSQGDADFERDILECLLADVDVGMDQLRDALDPLDPVRVATTLHGIVGACRTVGADALAGRCREREQEAKGSAFAPAPDWLAALEREHADLVAVVHDHLDAGGHDRPAAGA